MYKGLRSAIAVFELTSVTTLAFGFISKSDSCSGVHDYGFLDDESILLETSNVATTVGKSNFVDLIGVEPDFVLSALQYGSGQALLKSEIYCISQRERRVDCVRIAR